MTANKLSDPSTTDFLLAGGGEMGQRIRNFDWGTTALGPIDTWPPSLISYVSLLLNTKFPMFIWWGEQLIQFYNDAYRPSLGKDGKHPTALGQRGEDCWPEIWPVIKPLIDQVMSGEGSTWSEDQLIPIYRNGRLEDVYWTFGYSPIKTEDGRIGGVLVVCNETTGKVQLQKKIEKSEQNLRNIILRAPIAMCIFDGPEHVVKIANDRMLKFWGRAWKDVGNKPIFIGLPEAKDQGFEQLLNDVYTTGKGFSASERPVTLPREGGIETVYVNFAYEPLREANGSISGIMAVANDITDQVESRRIIEQAESRARLAIESAELGTYEIDLVSNELSSSEQYKVIWGVDRELTREEAVAIIHADDRPIRENALLLALITGNLHYEVRLLMPDASFRWVRVKGKVLYNPEGRPARLIGIVQNINAHKLFAQQLNKEVEERTIELQRSNDDLLQFAHVTSHDLKEPLRKIQVYSDRLMTELHDRLTDKGLFYVGKIEHATARMYAMIEGVLKYSTLSSSDHAIAPINLNTIITEIIQDQEVLIAEKKASFVAEELPSIEGAAVLIYQLFYNLINNALKFSRKDHPVAITISGQKEEQWGRTFERITVTDNGIGFHQSNAERMFDVFTRLNSKDLFEGTGLGLSLCKKIVERHGGSISAFGIKDEGATFTILLPLQQFRKTL